MNSNNLKSSTLHSQDSKSQPNCGASSQSLALVSLPDRSNQPTRQQKKTIARIYVEQARLYFQEQNWQSAIVACKNALEIDSQIADAYKILANILKLKGKKAEALGVYARALERPQAHIAYLRHQHLHTFTRDALAAIAKETEVIVEQIDSANYTATPSLEQCAICPYLSLCDYAAF